MAMLRSSNLSNPSNLLFVEQTIAHLFTLQLRKTTNTVTDIRGKIDILKQGGDIKPKKRWIEHVKKIVKENGVGYFKALSDPNCESTYKNFLKLVHCLMSSRCGSVLKSDILYHAFLSNVPNLNIGRYFASHEIRTLVNVFVMWECSFLRVTFDITHFFLM
jgi:hypothetical protein